MLDDGTKKKRFFLNRPHYGLLIPPGILREIENFSSNSVSLALISDFFDEKDYVRDYQVFKKMVKAEIFLDLAAAMNGHELSESLNV